MTDTDTTRLRVERLLWRAGVGPRPGEVDHWAAEGEAALVDRLLSPDGDALDGDEPTIDGERLDPANRDGHEVLWYLDRLVRTRQPLVERMALNWHDHFAVSNRSVGDNVLMLRYAGTLRTHALGSFRELTAAMTREPAMWQFLSLAGSTKEQPNENYARELMELFTLGANNTYTEADVREAARALTGFWWDYEARKGGFEPDSHDYGAKRILGRTGAFMPRDVVDVIVDHPAHAPAICTKMWGYLSPAPLPGDLLEAMVAAYTSSGTDIAATLRVALAHDAFFADLDRPDQVKPPLIYLSGMLRATGRAVDNGDWVWLLRAMGQEPFSPPNVAGWPSGAAWLSTATINARYRAGARLVATTALPAGESPEADVDAVRRALGDPAARPDTLERLRRLALEPGRTRAQARVLIAQMLLAGPDAQVC